MSSLSALLNVIVVIKLLVLERVNAIFPSFFSIKEQTMSSPSPSPCALVLTRDCEVILSKAAFVRGEPLSVMVRTTELSVLYFNEQKIIDFCSVLDASKAFFKRLWTTSSSSISSK